MAYFELISVSLAILSNYAGVYCNNHIYAQRFFAKEVNDIKNIFRRTGSFGVFCIITAIILLLALLNNFSTLFYSDFLDKVRSDSRKISDSLYEISRGISETNELTSLACSSGSLDSEKTGRYINSLSEYYIYRKSTEENDFHIDSFFYSIFVDGKNIEYARNIRSGVCSLSDIASEIPRKEISSGRWFAVKSGTSENRSLVYAEYISKGDASADVTGCIGASVDVSYIRGTFLANKENMFTQSFMINADDLSEITNSSLKNKKNLISSFLPERELRKLSTDEIAIKGFDVYAASREDNGIIFIRRGNVFAVRAESNVIILLVYIFALLVYFMSGMSKKYKQFGIFELVTHISSKFNKQSSNTLKKNTFAASLIFIAAAFATHLFYGAVSGRGYLYILQVFVFLLAFASALYIYDFVPVKLALKRLALEVPFILLLLIMVFFGDTHKDLYDSLLLMLMYIGICIYTLKRRIFIRIFFFMMSSTACAILISIIVKREFIDETILLYAAIAFICAFAFFILHLILVRSQDAKTKEKSALLEQLKDTQEIIIANERMTTLGHIIASVAHEINTPMGAIKASADAFSTNLVPFMEKFTSKVSGFSEDDRECVFDLMALSSESVKALLGTSEIRSAKRKIKTLLAENDIENAFDISNKLARLEICSLEEVQKRIDIFKKENIEEILNVVCDSFFLITGINTTVIGSNKVSKIVYALKSYSNLSSFSVDGSNIEEFSITDCIDNVITLYSNQFTDKISIVRSYDPDVQKIIGNSEGISQMCMNIIQNALYAMKDLGGTLTITTKKVNDMIYLEFGDTGCGIPPENIEKIYDPLFTTKSIGEGSGLGLGIVKRIVEGHKGTINVTSIMGEGTSFFITLPLNPKLKEIKNS